MHLFDAQNQTDVFQKRDVIATLRTKQLQKKLYNATTAGELFRRQLAEHATLREHDLQRQLDAANLEIEMLQSKLYDANHEGR